MRDDEGCQGNPPCQPASAYFSPLALAINTASPGAPGPNATPSVPSAPCRPPCPAAPLRTSPSPSSAPPSPYVPLHVRITVDRHKPTPPLPRPPLRLAPSSRDSLLRLSSGVFSSIALYLYPLSLHPNEFVLKISFYATLYA